MILPSLLPLISAPAKSEESRKMIYPLLSPQLGFKPEYLMGRNGLPVNGWALGYEAGLQFGAGIVIRDHLHVFGLQNRFKDLYTLGKSPQTLDWKSWNLQLFYSYEGALSGGIGPGYSWSRRSEQGVGSRDGFHLNADFRINPLFMGKKKHIHWMTMELQVIDLSVYFRFPAAALGAGIFLKAWLPLTYD